jgi:prepilin-type N-terminal cleavage/methylation domain-containing protein
MRTTPSPRGVTLVEAMISLAVLGVGLLGAMGALQQAAVESRLAQTRQHKMMLADAALQRFRLQDKNAFFTALPPQPLVDVTSLAVGVSPWVRDPTATTDLLDFSQGSYFKVLPDGTIEPVALPGSPGCDAVPAGIVCRETFVHAGGPFNGTNIVSALPPGTRVATAWVRLSRRSSPNLPVEVDVVMSQVVVQ